MSPLEKEALMARSEHKEPTINFTVSVPHNIALKINEIVMVTEQSRSAVISDLLRRGYFDREREVEANYQAHRREQEAAKTEETESVKRPVVPLSGVVPQPTIEFAKTEEKP